jgi:V8-like Glu-specific endopeptidase
MVEYMKKVYCISLIMTVLLTAAIPCHGELYKYKKDGVWHYTDSPPREMVGQSEVLAGSMGNAPPPSPEGTPLLEDYPARSNVELAAAATVAVKGAMGYGSGFFITSDGYVITNKHVVRTTGDQEKQEKKFFSAVEGSIQEIETGFREEKKRLDDYAENLNELQQLAQNEKDPLRKKSYEDEYGYRRKEYDDAKADYEERLRQYRAEKKDYTSRRSDYAYDKIVGNLSQSFEIILADNTQLTVRLVATSQNHDLALLKLDGYKTPALKTANAGMLIAGLPVFAIGNPAKLQNSVTSGVFSGFENGFIKTNAQIYPGNSGGPLVTMDGSVAGINTFKQLTHKYEGLGFAIPIGRAFDEFSRYLR